MEETGQVIAVEGGVARVRLSRHASAACHACGLCKMTDSGMVVEVAAPEGVKPGDKATVGVPLPPAWRGVLLLFFVPLALLIGGVAGGQWLFGVFAATRGQAKALAALTGVVLFAAAYAVAWATDRAWRKGRKPVLLRVAPAAPGAGEGMKEPHPSQNGSGP